VLSPETPMASSAVPLPLGIDVERDSAVEGLPRESTVAAADFRMGRGDTR
jgi:hypothetical protein